MKIKRSLKRKKLDVIVITVNIIRLAFLRINKIDIVYKILTSLMLVAMLLMLVSRTVFRPLPRSLFFLSVLIV
jgi:hypothetical protein